MSAETKPAKTSGCLKLGLLYGCLPMVVVGGALLGLFWFSARRAMDVRSEALRKEIESLQAEQSEARPVFFGPPSPGNAADEYWLINYVLGPPTTWDRKPPVTVAPSKFAYNHARINKIDVSVAPDELWRRVRRNDRSPLTGKAARFFKVYGPLADHIRAGLRKERCDWGPVLTQGVRLEILELIRVQNMAKLMLYQAFLAEPGADIEKALEVVVFARELMRHPSFILSVVAGEIESKGLELIEKLLRREQSSSADRRLVEVLGALKTFDVGQSLKLDRLAWSVTLSANAGNPGYEGAALEEQDFGSDAKGVWTKRALSNPVFLNREWEEFEVWSLKSEAIARLPASERGVAWDGFQGELNNSWTLLALQTIPEVIEVMERVEALEARKGAVRMLAAAHLHRKDKGVFPKAAKPLKAILSTIPLDPFLDRKKPLVLSTRAGVVTVSWAGGRFSVSTKARKETVK